MLHSVTSFVRSFISNSVVYWALLTAAGLISAGGVKAQTLTISSAASSGSGWSISSGTLTVTANSTVNVTDITDALNSGSLAIVGNTSAFTVTISNAITSTAAGSGLTIGSAGNTGTVTVGANLSINGPITIDGGNIILGGTLTSSQTSAAVTLRSLTNITNTAATTVSTQNGDVLFASNVDDATDGDETNYGYIRLLFGLTVTSNGGNITLGGGNTNGTEYATGNTTSIYTGIRVDAVLNLNAGGGNIIMKGKSPSLSVNDGWGVGFANVTSGASINSGAGTILFDGYSQSTVGNNISGLFFGSAATITTTNESANAIQLIGKATGASGEAWGLESESTLSLIASNDNGGITISTSTQAGTYDVVLRNNTDILAKSGAIQMLAGQSGGSGNGYFYKAGDFFIGSKASSAVTSSSSDITIQYDRFDFQSNWPRVATAGGVTVRPFSNNFGADFYTIWFQWNQNGQTMSSLTLGKPSNSTYNILHQTTPLTVAGPISIYAGIVYLNQSLTSTATGDIFLKGNATGWAVQLLNGYSISKTGGTGTLTMQSNAGVYQDGDITASGTGVLNVVFWTDYSNTNSGGIGNLRSITTNGGHVWMGGSSTAGGSYTWNGLSVGDGPSVGNVSLNHNAIGLVGNISTSGGDFFAWAGPGYTNEGIAVNGGSTQTLSVGTGDIVFVTDKMYGTYGSLPLYCRHTGGTFTLVPTGGSFLNTFNWNPVVESAFSGTNNIWNFTGDFDILAIENVNTLASTTIGRYEGMLSGSTPVQMTNSTAVTITTATSFAGPVSIYGGLITLSGNITTSSGDISIYSDNSLSVSSSRTITAAGMFKYMPNGTSFASAVSYPVGNLTVSSNGLQLGKPGNTAALTITGASSSNGPVTVFTGDFTTNASATLTATSSALEVTASGNVTLNAALAGSSTTVNVQGDLQTIGTLTNVNLTGGNTQSLTGTATLNNLTLNKTSNTATLTSGRQDLTGTLTLTAGTLAAGGKLVLKSTASGTARVAEHATSTGTVTGNVVVERFIPSTGSRKKQWRMLGFPYSADITPGDVSGIGISYSGSQTMMLFNETNDNGVYGTSGRNGGYAPLGSATASIPAGRGVATWIYNIDNSVTPSAGTLGADLTISSQGPLNETGASFTLSGLTNNVQGWHLIANPYASTIDWDVVYNASTNVNATMYRWDPQAEDWSDYNGSTNAYTGIGTKHIESGSAFFIKAASAPPTTISLVFPQSAKISNGPNLHFTKVPFRLDVRSERIGAATPLAGLRVKASGMGNPIPGEAYLDVSRLDATKGWDPKYDGMMMSRSAGANIYFDGAADNDYSMQFDAPLMNGEQRYYPLTVTTPAAGETTIEINSEGRWSSMHSVALIDQQLGRTILMQGGEIKYKFNLEALKSEGRFLLAINHIKLDADGQLPGFEVKALGNPVTGNTIDLLLTHPTATAKAWRVIDITGREAGAGTFAKDAGIQYRLAVPGMRNPGVYVVQISMDNGETQQLRILKN